MLVPPGGPAVLATPPCGEQQHGGDQVVASVPGGTGHRQDIAALLQHIIEPINSQVAIKS